MAAIPSRPAPACLETIVQQVLKYGIIPYTVERRSSFAAGLLGPPIGIYLGYYPLVPNLGEQFINCVRQTLRHAMREGHMILESGNGSAGPGPYFPRRLAFWLWKKAHTFQIAVPAQLQLLGNRNGNRDNSLVTYDESGHGKFPFSFVVLSWGELG